MRGSVLRLAASITSGPISPAVQAASKALLPPIPYDPPILRYVFDQ